MKQLSWFFDRIDQKVRRGDTIITITSKNYDKLYSLQSPGYTFDDIVLVHKNENTTCTSCEG